MKDLKQKDPEYFDSQEEDDEDDFQPCDHCDLPDACADFGCAIKMGIKKTPFDYE